jgi:hypothetical protein
LSTANLSTARFPARSATIGNLPLKKRLVPTRGFFCGSTSIPQTETWSYHGSIIRRMHNDGIIDVIRLHQGGRA